MGLQTLILTTTTLLAGILAGAKASAQGVASSPSTMAMLFCRTDEDSFNSKWREATEEQRNRIRESVGDELFACAVAGEETWHLRRAQQLGFLTPENARRYFEDRRQYSTLGACTSSAADIVRELFPTLKDVFVANARAEAELATKIGGVLSQGRRTPGLDGDSADQLRRMRNSAVNQSAGCLRAIAIAGAPNEPSLPRDPTAGTRAERRAIIVQALADRASRGLRIEMTSN